MKNSRRSFIKNGSIVLAGAGLLPQSFSAARSKEVERCAIQLASLDIAMHTDAAATLHALKKLGYNAVEHADYNRRTFYGFSPVAFRRLLSDAGLQLVSGHTVLEPRHWNKTTKQFTRDWQYAIEDAATAGQQFLISPWLDRSLWNDETKLRHFMDVFNYCGEACKKSGLQFGYHNHDFEFTHYMGTQRLYDVILQQTNRNLVAQQLDIGNIHVSHFSVSNLIKQHPGRFQLMHVKNFVASTERNQPFKSVPLAAGVLPMQNIIETARSAGGTTCFIMEQTNHGATEPLANAQQNLTFFQQLGKPAIA